MTVETPSSTGFTPEHAAAPGHADEFENLIDAFIERRSGGDDRLPAQTFFELLAELHVAFETVST